MFLVAPIVSVRQIYAFIFIRCKISALKTYELLYIIYDPFSVYKRASLPFLSYQSHHVKELVFPRLLAGPGKGPFSTVGYSSSWMQRTSKDSRGLPPENRHIADEFVKMYSPLLELLPSNAPPPQKCIAVLIPTIPVKSQYPAI